MQAVLEKLMLQPDPGGPFKPALMLAGKLPHRLPFQFLFNLACAWACSSTESRRSPSIESYMHGLTIKGSDGKL